jgi:hypothetical protein
MFDVCQLMLKNTIQEQLIYLHGAFGSGRFSHLTDVKISHLCVTDENRSG